MKPLVAMKPDPLQFADQERGGRGSLHAGLGRHLHGRACFLREDHVFVFYFPSMFNDIQPSILRNQKITESGIQTALRQGSSS